MVLSHCNDEAFELARKHGKLEMYGEILLSNLSPDELRSEDFVNLAQHFENNRNILLAGKYWFHARDYQKVCNDLFSFFLLHKILCYSRE